MYSLILSDIDGTLLQDDLKISPSTITAFEKAREKGIRIVLCSGRYIQGISFLAKELGIKDPIYSAINGALIKDGNNYLNSCMIDKESYEKAMKILGKKAKSTIAFSETKYAIHSDMDWYNLQDRICNQKGIMMDLESFDDVTKRLKEPIYKILVKDDREIFINSLRKKVEKALHGKAKVIASSKYNFEVLALGTSKGNTIDILEKHLDIPRQDMIAFGDWDNDIDMLRKAGMGIAMGNGSEKAKASANLITRDNNSDGIYYALHDMLKLI